MNSISRDRWPWLSLAAAVAILIVGTKLLSKASEPPRRHSDTASEHANEPTQSVPSQGIPLSALRTLSTSPVPSIRSAAIALANKRLGDKRTYRALIASVKRDLDSPNDELKKRAQTAMAYLDAHVTMSYLPPREASIASTTSPSDEPLAGVREQIRALWDEQSPAHHQSRPRTAQAPADRERRRRRREAMLFHEGSGELSEGDIIELNTALAEIAMNRGASV